MTFETQTLEFSLSARAQEMSQEFETKKNQDGESYRTLKDSAPSWMTEVIRAGHLESLPNDIHYNAIELCIDAIAEELDSVEIEKPSYTYVLTNWIDSDVGNLSYVDEAILELGDFDIYDLLEYAYMLWLTEIYVAIKDKILERIER
jgi:hypothetical protein